MPLRRLTRTQYANTVRDLLAPALRAAAPARAAEAAARFPADDRVGPFAANGTAPVADAHARLYLDAAEALAEAATTPEALPGLLPCAPARGAEAACAEQFIHAFGRRAFRRPLATEVVAALKALYATGAGRGGFAGGVRLVVQAILAAPDLVYHVEVKPAQPAGRLVPLDGFEVASRLSYFLWDSMPDEALRAAAEAGRLGTPAEVRAQAERMLGDGRARDALARLAIEWMGIDGVENLTRDPRLFPAFGPAVPAALRAETIDFVDHVVRRGDGLLSTLVTATFSLPGDPLLRIYGATKPLGYRAGTPLPLPAAERAGLLTHASVLAATAHADQTSPVKRGMLLLTNLLCHEMTFPEGLDVPALPDPDPKKTTRERFVQHTTAPACAVCHVVIDPLGFAFERYDPIGAYRQREGSKTIDDTGAIAVGDPALDGPVAGAVALAGKLAASSKLRSCVVRQVQRFALARHESAADGCAFVGLQDAFARAGFNVRELLLAATTADTFRLRPPSPSPSPPGGP
jgi:hypothetical protein